MNAPLSALRDWISTRGQRWLADENIVDLDIAHKVVEGMTMNAVCLRFTVVRKLSAWDPAATIPPYLGIGDQIVPTDVVESRAQAGRRAPAGASRAAWV